MSAPETSASSLETNDGRSPFSRTSNAAGGVPARESDPRATTSISGCTRTRSSVSWPTYPVAPRIAVASIRGIMTLPTRSFSRRLACHRGIFRRGASALGLVLGLGRVCLHRLAEAPRTHVRPDLIDVGQALVFRARLADLAPAR